MTELRKNQIYNKSERELVKLNQSDMVIFFL